MDPLDDCAFGFSLLHRAPHRQDKYLRINTQNGKNKKDNHEITPMMELSMIDIVAYFVRASKAAFKLLEREEPNIHNYVSILDMLILPLKVEEERK